MLFSSATPVFLLARSWLPAGGAAIEQSATFAAFPMARRTFLAMADIGFVDVFKW